MLTVLLPFLDAVLGIVFVVMIVCFPRAGRTSRQRILIAIAASAVMLCSLGTLGFMIETRPR